MGPATGHFLAPLPGANPGCFGLGSFWPDFGLNHSAYFGGSFRLLVVSANLNINTVFL